MKLDVWENSGLCLLGDHCVACRSTGAQGAQFRANIARQWEVPKETCEKGFVCPHGVPWDVSVSTAKNHRQLREMEGNGWEPGAFDGGCNC